MQKIILASASPRRKQLLELAEIDFEVMVSNVEEIFPEGISPAQAAMHIAENKAIAIYETLDNGNEQTIIAADTVVVLNDEILGKPSDRKEAIEILEKLSGKTHKVITGVCILSSSNKTILAEETEVEFSLLSKKQLEHYVDNYKPYDKAGAYAIQEWIGAIGIKSIKGDFYNVMGLPVSRVVEELRIRN
ncbi:MAG TPA: Maf family protein [Hanamia sp.]|nr:Maf family protein [Hanamia sp.]